MKSAPLLPDELLSDQKRRRTALAATIIAIVAFSAALSFDWRLKMLAPNGPITLLLGVLVAVFIYLATWQQSVLFRPCPSCGKRTLKSGAFCSHCGRPMQ